MLDELTDFIVISKDNTPEWIFNEEHPKCVPLDILFDLHWFCDYQTHIWRTSISQLLDRYRADKHYLDKNLKILFDNNLIEIYKDKHYVYIAARHNKYLDFEGEETFLKLDYYTFSSSRLSPAYKEWRDSCLKRDQYKCQKCGTTEGLCVHHIKPYAKFPKLATTISNGITLCQECHKEEHRRMRNGNL